MSELQAGMLALVIGCTRNPANIGKIVTADQKVTDGFVGPEGYKFSGEFCWLVRGSGLIRSLTNGSFSPSDYCYIADEHLLPIKPEADPLDVTHKEELHA